MYGGTVESKLCCAVQCVRHRWLSRR
jgi:hypothetical protein